MNRWNPHEFLKEGRKSGYNENYLSSLVSHGESISETNSPVVFTLAHLAHCSRTLYSDLHGFVARKQYSKDFPYKHFPIQKRSGGTRWISVPVPPLWAVQAWIANSILKPVTPHRCSTAYATGCSPKANAQKHCQAAWMLKLDIEDFFGYISEKQVFHVFRSLNYTPLLSFEMARLCTKIGQHNRGKRWRSSSKWQGISEYFYRKQGCLPQGAPTSPMLSNLTSREMDNALHSLARSHGGTYTRYADDITFSFTDTSRSSIIDFKNSAVSLIEERGFHVNTKKTVILPPGARKIVTGLIVNDTEPKLKKEYKDRIRAHLYYSFKFGVAKHCENIGFNSIIGFKNHLEGLIHYAFSVQPELGMKYYQQLTDIDWGGFDQ